MVNLILDLAGYSSDKDLTKLVAIEPSAGDGAFLQEMVSRLVASCRKHGRPLEHTLDAIRAFEIDPLSAEEAAQSVTGRLVELGVNNSLSATLAKSWIKAADFLEASLGFPVADFVVGNPPYIRLEEISPDKVAFYRSFSAMRGRADLYVAFFQAALMQLKPEGVCAFICADRWMLNDYGSGLREFVTTQGYSVQHVIDAHDVDAFENEVSAYPAVTIIKRAQQGPVIVSKAYPGIENLPASKLVRQLTEVGSSEELHTARFDQWFEGGEPWPCSSPEALQLLKHLEASCRPLEDTETGTKVGIGVATGADRVFVVSTPPDIESDRLLPLALAADLVAGKVEWSGHYLINPWSENGLVKLEDYPRMAAYLEPHRALLSGRHTAKDRPLHWHKTIDRVTVGRTAQSKLYIADIKDRLLPALDSGQTYPHHNLYWITSEQWDLRVLGALLMSSVGEFFIKSYSVRMRGGFFRFQAQYLRRIRVPDPSSLDERLKQQLREAFDRQDVSLATAGALRAYGIAALPDETLKHHGAKPSQLRKECCGID